MYNFKMKVFFRLWLLVKKIKIEFIKIINRLEEYNTNFSKKIEKENNKYKKFFALLIHIILIFIFISLFLTALVISLFFLVILLFLFLFIIILIFYFIWLYFISLFLPLLFILKIFWIISRWTLFKFIIIFIVWTSIIAGILFYFFAIDEKDMY